ncbi:MAG: acyl-CoA dehydrogenase [Runella sp.]
MHYSPGILSVLPIFYVGWSDSVLSPSEMKAIQAFIEKIPHLTQEDKQILQSWADQRHPPSKETFAEWKHILQKHAKTLAPAQRRSLVDIGVAMAQKSMSASSSEATPNPALREAVEAFEHLMGLDNHTSKQSFYHSIWPQLDDEFVEAGFSPQKLQAILDGPFAPLKERTKTLLLDEAFRVPTDLRHKDELRLKILEQCRYLAQQGLGSYAFPKEYGGSGSTGGSTAIFETLALGNLSLLIKFGVQFGLFGGAVYQLGTEQHHRLYLEKLSHLDLAGCFAMTETGHGSNVRDLETTATYQHDTRTIVVHSPTPTAGKEYIGNALHSHIAAVFCQLIVNGQNHGIHTILVPLRDQNHQTLPGITIKDNGYKMGLNGVDNGRIWFDNVHVPVENLLNRYGSITENGQYHSPIQNPSKRFFTMLGALVGGRVSVALGANTAAKKALDIAIRYALKRRQFKTLSETQETLLLDYPTHQERLFPLLAKSYALTFALETLRQKFVESAELEDKREVEALAAGLKSYASWHATATIQECREACGGKGYLAENELPDLKADTDIFATFEGDNYVLLQLLAKSILTDFKQEFSDGGFMAVARHLLRRASNQWAESNPFSSRNTDAEHLLSADFLTDALRYRQQKLLFSLSDRLRSFMSKKLNPNEIFLRTQTHMIALAMAYVERFVNEEFLKVIETLPNNPEKIALRQMQQIFALDAIHRDRGWYLENDYLSGDKSKAIRKVLTHLYRQLRPQAIGYVEAFGIPAVLRNAEIVG